MEIRYLPDPQSYRRMTTDELRAAFLVGPLFESGRLNLIYCDADRAVIGAAIPTDSELTLLAGKELASDFFTQRREVGIINLGGTGLVRVDWQEFRLERLDALYIGRGAQNINLISSDSQKPAEFYLQSYPAHQTYPTRLIHHTEARQVPLGQAEQANIRTIYQYIRPGIVDSCQLVMGLTIISPGSVWNTMPAHTHARRTEIYLYFDVPEQERIFHFMGLPQETRHLVIKNKEAVFSPSWSIHAGVGSAAYGFIWGMGGENQEFEDMDGIAIEKLS